MIENARRAEVRDSVTAFLADVSGRSADSFPDTVDLAKGDLLDSIQLIQFLFFLEEKFEISVDIERLTAKSTIADVVDAVVESLSLRNTDGV